MEGRWERGRRGDYEVREGGSVLGGGEGRGEGSEG